MNFLKYQLKSKNLPQSKKHKHLDSLRARDGFSLLELMIVLTIIAISLSFALPSIKTNLINSGLKKTAEQLLYSLKLTRSYALANYGKVRLCATKNGDSCDTNNYQWNLGYGIEIEINNQKKIIEYQTKIKDDSFRILKNNNAEPISFTGGGFATSNNNSFGVCSDLSNRLYWIAIRDEKKGYLDRKPFLCTYKINSNNNCKTFTNSDMSASNISNQATLIDGQLQNDCHNSS